MAELTAAEVLRAADAPVKALDVPEWGGTVYIRTITGRERDLLEGQARNGRNGNLRGTFAAMVLCNAAGERLFTDGDALKVGAKSGRALDRIFDAGVAFNGLSDESAKALEENSESIPSDDSGSA